MSRRRALLTLGAILLAGAFVRLAYLGDVRARQDFARPTVDALFHDYWARGLATDDWTPPAPHQDPRISENPYFRPPGYPYFLAFVHLLSGGSATVARLAQMALGLGGCLLLFLIGRRWFGTGAGLLAAGAMATVWSFVYFEGELLEPPLLAILLVGLAGAAGLWADRPTLPRCALAGILLGLAALVRPNALVLLPVVVAWGWPAVSAARGRTGAFGQAALLAAACVAVIVPATARNYLVSGEFVLISTNGGINLFIGNNDAANGECTSAIAGLGKYETSFDYLPLVNLLADRERRPLTHSAASAIFAREAVSWARENPLQALRLAARKTLLFWGPQQVSHNREDEIDREASPVLRLLPLGFPLVLALAALGAALLLRSSRTAPTSPPGRRMALLLVLLTAGYFASFLPFFVAGRYRVPAIPFLLLLGAGGLEALRLRWSAGDRRQVAAALAALAVLWAATSANWAGYRPDRARWHHDRGMALVTNGDIHGAITELERAVAIAPRSHRAQSDLGSAYAAIGDAERARLQWVKALELDPGYPLAHFNLARLERAAGNTRQAIAHSQRAVAGNPASWLYRLELAEALLAAARSAEAAAELRVADALDPGNRKVAALLDRIVRAAP